MEFLRGNPIGPAVERIVAVLVWTASLAPLWTWWTRRFAEPLDLDVVAWAALAVLVAASWRGRTSVVRPAVWKLFCAAVGLVAFHILRRFVPLTASGVFGIAAGIPLLLPESNESHPGDVPSVAPFLGLALMGLPTAMILDLFLGLPLRALATAAAVELLRLVGLPVVQTGLELAVGETSVWVDVPCAGIHMLGAGLLAAFVLAAVFGFRWGRTILLSLAAVFSVVVANIMRIVVLTLVAFCGQTLSASGHSAVGCVLLLPSVLLVAALAYLLERRRK